MTPAWWLDQCLAFWCCARDEEGIGQSFPESRWWPRFLPASCGRCPVKLLTQLLVAKAPGNSVEVRVPPYSALQVVAGVRHRRGTPPATVELSAQTFIELATGKLTWEAAKQAGEVVASGERSDLSALLPLVPMPPV